MKILKYLFYFLIVLVTLSFMIFNFIKSQEQEKEIKAKILEVQQLKEELASCKKKLP